MTYEDQLDAGAKALRDLDMAGRITVDWSKLPKQQKRKWWAKAAVVLGAAGKVSPDLKASTQPTVSSET